MMSPPSCRRDRGGTPDIATANPRKAPARPGRDDDPDAEAWGDQWTPADVIGEHDWSRPLLPRVKQIVAQYLMTEAPFGEDTRRNTDLIVLTLAPLRIAVRIRRAEYAATYGGEFTLRCSRPSGAQTELAKISAGWGDYLFYGFADAADPLALSRWLLADLSVFRLWHARQLAVGRRPWVHQANGDRSSQFRAYRIADLPAEFVIAAYPKGST